MNKSENYRELTHTWTDIFDDDKEKTASFRFCRPSGTQIKRLQSGAVKNASAASYQLLLDTVHPDDKERFIKEQEQYPALVTTFSGVILKSCGLADLGN